MGRDATERFPPPSRRPRDLEGGSLMSWARESEGYLPRALSLRGSVAMEGPSLQKGSTTSLSESLGSPRRRGDGGARLPGVRHRRARRVHLLRAVVHLLVRGEPPTPAELAELKGKLRERRSLSADLARTVDALPGDRAPLEALRSLVSLLNDGSFAYPPTLDQGLALIARAPTLLCRYVRRAAGLEPVEPDPTLDHVAN